MQNPGRFAGLLYVLASIVGFFAMGYVQNKLIIHADAAATLNNLAAHETLFRLGIAAELLSSAAFIFVALALYDLLQGVDRRLALSMVILIVISVPISFVGGADSLAAIALVHGADFLGAVDKPQQDALAMMFLRMHSFGMVANELFWGFWLFPLALLVYRSGFLPRFLGAWLALAGAGWVALSLTSILLPQFQSKVYTYTQPAVFGEVAFMFWLLIRGARPPGWAASQRLTPP